MRIVKNNVKCKVFSAYSPGGSLTVDDVSTLPTEYPFGLSAFASNENALSIVKITGRDANILTVDGTYEGTTDVDLAVGTVLRLAITAGLFEELNSALASKADASALASKADASALDGKADISALDGKADISALDGKADISDLAGKADNSAVVHLTGNESIAGTKTFSSPIAGTITGNISQSQVTNLSTALAAKADTSAIAGKADNSAVVHLTGNETIAGVKTFSSPIAGTITGSINQSQVTNLGTALAAKADASALASKANDSSVVHLTGNESIAGIKTFSSSIVGTITGNIAQSQVTGLTSALGLLVPYWEPQIGSDGGNVLTMVNSVGSPMSSFDKDGFGFIQEISFVLASGVDLISWLNATRIGKISCSNGKLWKVKVQANVNGATGGFSFNIKKSGTNIFATAQSVAASTTTVQSFSTFASTSVSENDVFTIDVTAAGVGVQDVTISLFLLVRNI